MSLENRLLKSYWFILGLSLLLINDFILKGLFHNWITGKLSDLAGLFIFPLFWTALFPKQKLIIFWLTSLLFVFWKSPYSQFLIDSWNYLEVFGINRVIDYSDLLTLFILPFAYEIEKRKATLSQVKTSPVIPAFLSVFAFLATTYDTTLKVDKVYTFDFPLSTLKKRIYHLPAINNWEVQGYIGYDLDSTGKFRLNKYSGESIPVKDSIELVVKDSMVLSIDDDFCQGYGANILISGDSLQSKIRLIGFHHTCPENGEFILPIKRHDDIKILTKSFETKVVGELKNNKSINH